MCVLVKGFLFMVAPSPQSHWVTGQLPASSFLRGRHPRAWLGLCLWALLSTWASSGWSRTKALTCHEALVFESLKPAKQWACFWKHLYPFSSSDPLPTRNSSLSPLTILQLQGMDFWAHVLLLNGNHTQKAWSWLLCLSFPIGLPGNQSTSYSQAPEILELSSLPISKKVSIPLSRDSFWFCFQSPTFWHNRCLSWCCLWTIPAGSAASVSQTHDHLSSAPRTAALVAHVL